MEKHEKTGPNRAPSAVDLLADEIERKLIREWGLLLSGEGLARALGYRSVGTMRQAIKTRTLPVPFFSIKDRRGKFVLAKHAARYAAEVSSNRDSENPPSQVIKERR